MLLRRIATAASTIVVAIVLAIFVPVAQLQTVAEAAPCCCPNPKKCKCPDHKGGDAQPTMRACKQAPDAAVQAQLSVFVPPAIEVAIAPARIVGEPHAALADPHPAPAPRRPDAPS